MKRLVLILLLLNLGYFGYSQGWWRALTGEDAAQREPQRITKQVNPDAIKIEPAPMARVLTATAATNDLCAETKRERWVIYMGPYQQEAFVVKKKAELQKLHIASQAIAKPHQKFGLSLGEYDTEAPAREALKELNGKGVKTATVVLWETHTEPCPKP